MTDRISGGAATYTPTCPSCPYLNRDARHPGWGWCNAPQNRVFTEGWPNGFTPSQSPTGTCNLHPQRREGADSNG
jgi:hypothetical protein